MSRLHYSTGYLLFMRRKGREHEEEEGADYTVLYHTRSRLHSVISHTRLHSVISHTIADYTVLYHTLQITQCFITHYNQITQCYIPHYRLHSVISHTIIIIKPDTVAGIKISEFDTRGKGQHFSKTSEKASLD